MRGDPEGTAFAFGIARGSDSEGLESLHDDLDASCCAIPYPSTQVLSPEGARLTSGR